MGSVGDHMQKRQIPMWYPACNTDPWGSEYFCRFVHCLLGCSWDKRALSEWWRRWWRWRGKPQRSILCWWCSGCYCLSSSTWPRLLQGHQCRWLVHHTFLWQAGQSQPHKVEPSWWYRLWACSAWLLFCSLSVAADRDGRPAWQTRWM